jgi:signal transduction histidine kinase/DNA-binding response OmpR family regulator/ligand-binding sensor domain-containing protein
MKGQKRKNSALLWFFISVNLFFTIHQAYSQVIKIGSQQGLSNNSVTAIFEDREGFMWFGTMDGLNKYDGYGFKVFRNLESRTHFNLDNKITAIGQTADGKMIVGTKKGGAIMSLHETNFSIIKYQSAHDHQVREIPGQIFNIYRQSANTQLLATSNQGVLSLREGSEVATQVAVIDLSNRISYNDFIQGITANKKGDIWFFIRGKGIGCLKKGEKTIRIVNNRILSARCIQSDKNGNILIGGIKLLAKYDENTNSWLDLHTSFSDRKKNLIITDINISNDGRFIISTDGLGLIFYSLITGKYDVISDDEQDGLSSPAVNCSYESKQGLVWVGTVRGGINVLDENDNSPFKVYAKGDGHPGSTLATNYIQSFCAIDERHIWIGTDGKGASLWDRKTNAFKNFRHQENNPRSISSDYVSNILKDSFGKVWFITYGGGINLFNQKTGDFVQYSCANVSQKRETGNVWALYEDTQNTLWVSTLGVAGLYRLNREIDKFELFDARLQEILVLKQDTKGILWAGNYTGLIKIDKKTKNHKVFNLGTAVRAIEIANPDGLWIGTEGQGLLYFDLKQEKVTRRYTEAQGLSNNTVLSVLKLKNNKIWLSTFKGLSEFNASLGKFKNFFENDGLPNNEFSYNAALKLSEQELLFGGINGFCLFNPHQLNIHPNRPALKITNVLINNQSVFSQWDELNVVGDMGQFSLPYDKAVITVEYTALEYRKPEKIKYSYYLEGWEEHWHYPEGYRKATYGKLPSGKYLLHVRSTDTEGNWLANEKTIAIKINPPFWLSWFAYVGYALMLMTGIFVYNRYKSSQQHFKNELALSSLKLEQEKALQEKKNDFFTHVSHELRSPLTLIVNPVKDLIESYQNQLNGEQLASLDIVYRNSKRLLMLVDKFLLLKRMESFSDELVLVEGSIVNVCKQVFQYYELHAKSKDIKYAFEYESEQGDLFFDREKIEIIVSNLLSNAFKYVSQGGSIILNISVINNGVCIAVKDDGSGVAVEIADKLFQQFVRDQDSRHNGFGIGLFLAKNYTEMHGGTIAYEPNVPGGSTFKVTLLKGKAHFNSDLIQQEVGIRAAYLEKRVVDVEESQINESGFKDEDLDSLPFFLQNEKPSILIIDDDAEIKEYLRAIFEKNYNVFCEDNAAAGLRAAYQHKPELILSDVMMKDMTGIEFCKEIRADEGLAHIPVFLLTADPTELNEMVALQGGADDYIFKPFDKSVLLLKVDNMIKSKIQMKKSLFESIVNIGLEKVSKEDVLFLRRLENLVHDNQESEQFNIKWLASTIGMSHSSLYKRIKNISGLTINDFVRNVKIKHAAKLLLTTNISISEAAYSSGFSDVKYFRMHFLKVYHLLPSDFVKKYRTRFIDYSHIKDLPNPK